MTHHPDCNIKKKTLIIGAGGRLGRDLAQTFRSDEVIPLAHADLNLSNAAEIEKVLTKLDFDRVLLSASLTAVDYCEENQEEAFQVNAEAPRLIAEIAASKNAHVTFMSTDFVFSGREDTPIDETVTPSPINVYGASKLKGEEAVLGASSTNLVARVSWLFGPSRPAFPEWILNKAIHEEKLVLPADKWASPTSSVEVAHFIKVLVDSDPQTAASGVYHLCNSGECSWQEWGQACLDSAQKYGARLRSASIAATLLEDIAAFVAKRPAYSVLDNSKFSQFSGLPPQNWKGALDDHFRRLLQQKEVKAAA